ncbi:MAG TPA: GNAT family N-acetyltransferase [Roseiflexaceae bacterium]|nr:GNAT family N-acetyltransferase [Roseiflexaceae bacterium]
MTTIDRLEEASFNAWPALEQLLADGWLLRFAEGYSRRANSANFLYPASADPERLLPWCEERYAAQGLPPTFRIVERPETATVEQALERRGYRRLSSSLTLSRPLDPSAPVPDAPPLAALALDEWLPIFTLLSGADPQGQGKHRRILEQLRLPHALGVLVADGQPVACGLAVVDRELVGLFDLVTHPAHRRRGHAGRLISAMLAWATGQGASAAYLQVAEQNNAARQLYARLGFQQRYRYWYRVRETGGATTVTG